MCGLAPVLVVGLERGLAAQLDLDAGDCVSCDSSSDCCLLGLDVLRKIVFVAVVVAVVVVDSVDHMSDRELINGQDPDPDDGLAFVLLLLSVLLHLILVLGLFPDVLAAALATHFRVRASSKTSRNFRRNSTSQIRRFQCKRGRQTF